LRFKRSDLKKKDEFFEHVAPDVVERLVTRPEDTLSSATQSIELFKDTLLRVLEVGIKI
jgi:hypothetical protein